MNFQVYFDNNGDAEPMTADPAASIATIRHNIAQRKAVSESDVSLYFQNFPLSDDLKLGDLRSLLQTGDMHTGDAHPEIHCHIKTEMNDTLDSQPFLDLPKEDAANLGMPTIPTLDDTTATGVVEDVLAEAKPQTNPWTEEENEELKKGINEFGIKNPGIKKIKDSFPNRSLAEIKNQIKILVPNKESKQAPWTDEEEQLLVEKVTEYGRKWSQIAQFFPNRTPRAIEGHWEKIMNAGKTNTTKPWTEEEETKLIEKVSEYGTKWTHIAQFFERTPKALERHWSKKMKKENKQSTHETPQPWSELEEQKLREKVAELGTNWQAISQYFNRTPGGIKLQWYRMKRRDSGNPDEE